MGFYPAHKDAVAAILTHLVPQTEKRADLQINIIDPCAGEGKAIRQIADALGVPMAQTYAVELDAARVEACKVNLPGANILGPASFLGCQVTGFSIGLAYVNPPFDNELGGGRREEAAFTERATRLLVAGGILVLVAPFGAVNGNRNFCQFLDSHYEDLRVHLMPVHVRHFNEIVLIARKRRVALPLEALNQHGELHKMEFVWRNFGWEGKLSAVGAPHYNRCAQGAFQAREPRGLYIIPPSWKPNTFKKVMYTDEELVVALARSPLNRLLQEIAAPPLARPPLPLAKGHVALLLASGMLDGVVNGPEGPHVVRGTARKVEYISSRSATENEETGAVTEKVVFSQKIVLTIRAVAETGVITTFSDEPKDKEADEDTNEGREDAA